MKLAFFVALACAVALLPLLRLLMRLMRYWLLQNGEKGETIEAQATILSVMVYNDRRRTVPFLIMETNILPYGRPAFTACLEAFCSQEEIALFTAGAVITVRFLRDKPASVKLIRISRPAEAKVVYPAARFHQQAAHGMAV